MHIELVGSTSAGKTTLAKEMVVAGKRSGIKVYLSDDFLLEQMHLNWVKNDFIRRRLVEFFAFAVFLRHPAKYNEFVTFVFREGKISSGSWLYKVNRIRNVIRKIGIFEFITLRSNSHQVVLADNEGLLQGVHNLFVHQNSHADETKIAKYVELIPLPDVILFLRQDETILVSRTLKRGHARVDGSSPEKVTHFIRQAIAVFDELIAVPKIQERLLVVDGEKNIHSENRNLLNANIHLVTDLVRS